MIMEGLIHIVNKKCNDSDGVPVAGAAAPSSSSSDASQPTLPNPCCSLPVLCFFASLGLMSVLLGLAEASSSSVSSSEPDSLLAASEALSRSSRSSEASSGSSRSSMLPPSAELATSD